MTERHGVARARLADAAFTLRAPGLDLDESKRTAALSTSSRPERIPDDLSGWYRHQGPDIRVNRLERR